MLFTFHRNSSSIFHVERINILYKVINFSILTYIVTIFIWGGNEEKVIYSTLACLIPTSLITIYMLNIKYVYFPKSYCFLILFYLFCLASYFWAKDQEASWVAVTRTLPLLIIFSILLYNYIITSNQIAFLLFTVYLAGIVLALVTIFTQPGGITGYFILLAIGYRIGDNINNVNLIGLAVGTSAIISIYYLLYNKKWIHIITFPICTIVALGTGSNKAFLLLVIGTFLMIALHNTTGHSLKILYKLTLSIALVIALSVMILQLPMFVSINKRFTGAIAAFSGVGDVNEATAERITLSKVGLEQFLKSPLIGIGVKNSGVITLQAIGTKTYLHNNYVELLAVVGIIGTLLFYATIISILIGLIKNIRLHDNLSLAIAVIFICWLVLQVGYVCYYDKITYVYFALGAAAAIPKIQTTNKHIDE